MSSSVIVERYVKTIFESAIEAGVFEDISNEFQKLNSYFESSSEWTEFLSNPIITPKKKLDILQKTICKDIPELMKRFLSLLIQKNRIEFLPQIAHRFQDFVDKHQGVVKGTVTSAKTISEKELKVLSNKFQKAKNLTFQFTNQIDPSLIGGFTIQIGDTVIDWSLKNKLEILRSRMIA